MSSSNPFEKNDAEVGELLGINCSNDDIDRLEGYNEWGSGKHSSPQTYKNDWKSWKENKADWSKKNGWNYDKNGGWNDEDEEENKAKWLSEEPELYEVAKCCGRLSPTVVHWILCACFWILFLLTCALSQFRCSPHDSELQSWTSFMKFFLMLYVCAVSLAFEHRLFKSCTKHVCLRLLFAPLYLFLSFELADQQRHIGHSAALARVVSSNELVMNNHIVEAAQIKPQSFIRSLVDNEHGRTAGAWLSIASWLFAFALIISHIFLLCAMRKMTKSEFLEWAEKQEQEALRKAEKLAKQKRQIEGGVGRNKSDDESYHNNGGAERDAEQAAAGEAWGCEERERLLV
ncbi:unnamed protein product [Amoebophrya sp. A25]|nr:unnamed protein product [Amoebophrya sp. A25]|eukprot:GSA25T00003035001.1